MESVLNCLIFLKEVNKKFFEGNISIKEVIIFVSCDNLLQELWEVFVNVNEFIGLEIFWNICLIIDIEMNEDNILMDVVKLEIVEFKKCLYIG